MRKGASEVAQIRDAMITDLAAARGGPVELARFVDTVVDSI